MDLDAEPSPPTAIHLPPSLPYPITLTSLFTPVSSQVTKGTKALSYTYTLKDDLRDGADVNTTDNKKRKGQEKGYATWEIPIDGEVSEWAGGAKVGAVIKDASQPIIYIQQPCAHPVQFHGMCAICGADLASQEYTTPATTNNSSARNANPNGSSSGAGGSAGGVEIEHNESGVKVSLEKAHSIALTQRNNLLSTRKLILIIDLDQTIIQTGCDLTTGKWMDECWGLKWGLVEVDKKGRGVVRQSDRENGDEGANAAGPHDEALLENEPEEVKEERKKNREENPNAEAIKDIWRFKMDDEDEVGTDAMGRKWVRKGRQGVWFYVKPRPGLQDFLTKMSSLYELHVYTAGTRSYANAICTCIDPTGKFFSERILSRNESGSASTKSLKRLFPTDESMVVVIDDRWEVWAHGRNLVKVIPYAFYPNTGDINSAFVEPRATDVPTGSQIPAAAVESSEKTDDPELEKKKLQSEAAAREVEIQVAEAPLAKRQEELDRQEAEGAEGDMVKDVKMLDDKADEVPHHKRAALVDNDQELRRIDKVLNEVHGRFYQAYDQSDKRVTFRPASEPTNSIPHDVRHIIPHMRRKVLNGCVICFSGIIPLNQRPEDNEFWLLASMFGARCQKALDKHVTHLVVAQADTQKVGQALRLPNTKVVWREWLRYSVDFCVRQPEEAFQIKSFGRSGGSPPRTPSRKGKERETTETAVDTSPPTPDVTERPLPAAVSAGDFDDIDAELEEFMGSDDDDDDDDDDSMAGSESGQSNLSPIASPTNRKRPRKTHMDENKTASQEQYDSSPSDSEEDGKMAQFSPETGLTNVGPPVTKRARYHHDDEEDRDNQYADIEKGMREEDYDEYPDEGSASELDDNEEYDPKDADEEEKDEEVTIEKASMT